MIGESEQPDAVQEMLNGSRRDRDADRAKSHKSKHDCSVPGADCSLSKCCRDVGMQCYRKDKYWSSCNLTCDSHVIHPSEPDGQRWSCEELGPRTHAKRTVCDWAG